MNPPPGALQRATKVLEESDAIKRRRMADYAGSKSIAAAGTSEPRLPFT